MTAAFFFLLSALPFAGFSPLQINYTGLLNKRPVITILCLMPCFLFYAFRFYTEGIRRYPVRTWRWKTLLILLLTAAVIAIPYGEKENFLSGLHVLLGYIDFSLLSLFLFQLIYGRKELMNLLLCGNVLALFTALSALSVNGLSELIYGLMIAVLFSFL